MLIIFKKKNIVVRVSHIQILRKFGIFSPIKGAYKALSLSIILENSNLFGGRMHFKELDRFVSSALVSVKDYIWRQKVNLNVLATFQL